MQFSCWFWKIGTVYPPPHQHIVKWWLFCTATAVPAKICFRKIQIPVLTHYHCVFQARNLKTGELAAVKIIKLEPGKRNLCPIGPQTTSVIVLWLRGYEAWPTDRDSDYWDYDKSFTPSESRRSGAEDRDWQYPACFYSRVGLILFWNHLVKEQMHYTWRRWSSVCVCASVCVCEGRSGVQAGRILSYFLFKLMLLEGLPNKCTKPDLDLKR